MKGYADDLMQLHDDLAEIKAEHGRRKAPSESPPDHN